LRSATIDSAFSVLALDCLLDVIPVKVAFVDAHFRMQRPNELLNRWRRAWSRRSRWRALWV